MSPKTTRTGGNKKSSENRKTTLRGSQKGCGSSIDPMDIMNSEVEETETILKPDKTDTMPQMEDESSQALNLRKYSQLLLEQTPIIRAIKAGSTPPMKKQG